MQVCNSCLPPLSMIEDLYISYGELVWLSTIENNLLEFLLPFSTVKNLYLPKEFVQSIMPSLQEIVRTEVLPSLQNIFMEGLEPLEPFQESIGQFIATWELSSHPITISACLELIYESRADIQGQWLIGASVPKVLSHWHFLSTDSVLYSFPLLNLVQRISCAILLTLPGIDLVWLHLVWNRHRWKYIVCPIIHPTVGRLSHVTVLKQLGQIPNEHVKCKVIRKFDWFQITSPHQDQESVLLSATVGTKIACQIMLHHFSAHSFQIHHVVHNRM